jgi:hypothetical protein
MAINFSIDPYYDDFDETKNYHRILFRPGYAVQARELTQLQTQLQDQINKFGKHIFVNGSLVKGLGGNRLFDLNLTSIKLNSTYSGTAVNLSNFLGKTITGVTSGTKAIVKTVADVTTGGDPKTLFVSITSGNGFTAGENITTGANLATIQSDWVPTTKGMSFSIDSSIFFVDGKFIYLEPQSVAIDKYTNTSSKKIGLLLVEDTINSDEDSSLLDNAQGSPNYAAPGADRYKAYLQLKVLDINETLEGFVEIARVVDGEKASNQETTLYSELSKELARRTFDESGDYTVKAWPIQIMDDVSSPSAPDKFTVALDPGKAYVKGYEFETENQTFLTLDRARREGDDDEQVSGIDISLFYGNYVYVTKLRGPFWTNSSTTPYTTVEIHDDTTALPSNVVDDTTKIGTAKVRYIQLHQTDTSTLTAGGNSIYRMYLFDIVLEAGKTFRDARSIVYKSGSGAYVTGGADIDDLSSYSNDVTNNDIFLGGADSPGLVFPMPNQYIKTIKDKFGDSQSDYTLQRTFGTGLSTSGIAINSGVIDLPALTGNETFFGSVGALADDVKNTYYHAVVTAVTSGSAYEVGEVLSFKSSEGKSITIGGAGKTIQFDLNEPSFSGYCIVIATINANGQTEKTKILSSYSKVVLGTGSAGGLNITRGGKDSLLRSDIFDVKHVYYTSVNPSAVDVNPTTGEIDDWKSITTHPDVLSNYSIDDGQRAEYYDHGNLVLTGTAPNATYYLLVVYRNFTHSGTGFASRDSYAVDYDKIPKFTDPSSGILYTLRDCIDFRPRRSDGGSSLEGGQLPVPWDTLNADYQYWLGRIDKIIATQDKTFVIKKGISAVYPQAPIDESNGMTIYAVIIPPYTADVREVQIKYVENRRYTMRDIGRLEKRVSNLEYYTQLSLLEKQAKDTSVKDSNTIEKFKNGFATDPFTSQEVFASSNWSERRWGWWNAWFNGSNTWNTSSTMYNANSLADTANVDFNAAIDPLNQELRAPFTVKYTDFDTSTLTNTERNGDLVTLSYSEVTAISQPLASGFVNINPFNVIRFIGNITLVPAFDSWINTVTLPDTNLVVETLVPGTIEQDVRIDNNRTRFTAASGRQFNVESTTVTLGTAVVGTSTTDLGTSVVDVQYVPYIRANTVLGIGKLFKPKSRIYPFVENTPIASYVKPLTILRISGITGTGFIDTQGAYEELSIRTTAGSAGSQTGTAKVAIYSQESTTITGNRLLTVSADTGTIIAGKYVVGLTSNTVAYIEEVTTSTLGANLIPDEFGNLGFEFQIPNNVFKTGERTIRLIDNSENDVELQQSIGEAKYTATGEIQSKQRTILTTRRIQNTRTTTRVGYYDPLAQSFIIYPNEYPLGLHVASVDVYFKSKSSTVSVEMQIRNNVNGYPESQPTIPFSSVVLKPEQVNVSDSGNTATKFVFENPIHLTPGDYSIVLLANTQEYNVFIAEIGEPALGGTIKIDKQPYIGSLFKSQNASTWEPDQNKDLKFKLNRAVFTGATGYAEFDIQDPGEFSDYSTLFTHVASVLPTGTSINWSSKSYRGTVNGATGAGTLDTEWTPLNVNQDVAYPDVRQIDTEAHASKKTLKLRAALSLDPDIATKNEVSPIIDVASIAAITADNSINNNASGEASVVAGGSAIARYISKSINLASGFEASNICVTVDINKPQGTDVKVYYRALATEKTTPLSDEEWILMEAESDIASSLSNFQFKEHRYFPPNYIVGNVPVDSPISPSFNSFQIKIVLLSSSKAYTPRLRDLRVIALDS